MILGLAHITAWLAAYLGLGAFPNAFRQSTCRCTSDQDCWPAESDFQILSSQVSQPLIYPIPAATSCYISNYCATTASLEHTQWRANQPGAFQWSNWESFTHSNGTIDACYRNTSLGTPCKQGSVPVVGVDARSPEDIQAAIKFVSKHNLRFVIKNTGHDFLGRSSARGSFMIWTHNMKGIAFHDTFTPFGADSSTVYDNVFTFESGVQWSDAYKAASARKRNIVGGISLGGTVGAFGGWISGAGHGILAPAYGLGIDHVLQMTIVTADGSHLIANEYTNSDIFWALRGGGGGTWGVLTSVSYRTHPATEFSGGFIMMSKTDPSKSTNPNVTQELLAEVIRQTGPLLDQDYGGYCFATRNFFGLWLLSPYATWEQTNRTLRPFFDYAVAQAKIGGFTIDNYTSHFESFDAFYNPRWGDPEILQSNLEGNNEISSWLLPEDVVLKDPESLAATLIDLPGMGYFLVAGSAVSRVDPESMGINPAWRKALAYVFMSFDWPDGISSQELDARRVEFKQAMAKLESIAPDSGAYFNEASAYEFDWKKSFFGSHYRKLRAIKDKYDRDHMFIVWEGVGSDEWDSSLNCRLTMMNRLYQNIRQYI